MPLPRCAAWSAQVSAAFTLGCARSRLDRAALRQKLNCAGTLAGSLPPSAGTTAGPDPRRTAPMMRDMGLQASRGRRRTPKTTDSHHDLPIAPNLLGRSFVAEQPDAVWLADIVEILSAKSGWLG